MSRTGRSLIVVGLALAIVPACVDSNFAQSSAATVYHQIDGRLHSRSGQAASNVRLRLLRSSTMRPVGETFSRSRGEFEFNFVTEGEYIVETFETEDLEASSTTFHVRPLPRERSAVLHIEIDIGIKPPAAKPPPGVIAADVDLQVPKEALKHYRQGMKALGENDPPRAVGEFQEAIKLHPEYYAARLGLGRELRREKRFKEAQEALLPLRQIAPKRAEPLVEHALVFLDLKLRAEAASELRSALQLEEANWSAHFYLGWALIEEQPDVAEPHFKRALELDENKAVRAHLALARLADAKGLRELAIRHLDAYLVLVPSGTEAEIARTLVKRLRRSTQAVRGNSPQP